MAVNAYDWIPHLFLFFCFSPCHGHTGLFTERLQCKQVMLGLENPRGSLTLINVSGVNTHVLDDACLCRSKVNTYS